jgi:hypothetical protein
MTSRRQPILLLLALVATLVAAGVSCKGEDEESTARPEAAAAKPPAVRPKPQKPGPGEKRGPGTLREQFAREVELPDGYPEDAPRYPGAKINASAWQQGRVAATFSTGDTPEKVTSYVKQQLGSNGWESTPEVVEFESGIVLAATKPAEGRMIQVMIATMDQGDDDWVTLIAVVTDPTGS